MRLGLGDSIFDDTVQTYSAAQDVIVPDAPAVPVIPIVNAVPTLSVAPDYMEYLPYAAALGIVWYLTKR